MSFDEKKKQPTYNAPETQTHHNKFEGIAKTKRIAINAKTSSKGYGFSSPHKFYAI